MYPKYCLPKLIRISREPCANFFQSYLLSLVASKLLFCMKGVDYLKITPTPILGDPYLRVLRPLSQGLTETPSESILTFTENYVALSLPDDTAPVVGNFSAGDKLPTLGRFSSFAWAKMPGGVYAWAKVAKQQIPTLD